MSNIKLIVAYDGTGYGGWQRQSNRPTIQGELEEKISLIANEKVVVHGAGRTDAGVHAYGMAASFHTRSTVSCEGFLRGLNSLLADDIRVLDAEEVAAGFHARKSASGKCYIYNLAVGGVQIPTERLYSYNVFGSFDVDAVVKSLQVVVGSHDFSSFEATGSRDMDRTTGRGAVRRIFTAAVEILDNEPLQLQIKIAGDGFLRHMVRNIVGTLIEVGQGRRSVNDFHDVLKAKDRSLAGPTAPAKGLFLKEVYY